MHVASAEVGNAIPRGAFFECKIEPSATNNFSLALFRMWMPQLRDGPIKGILAVLPGSDMHGIPSADDAKWQAIAEKWNYALLGITFTTRSGARPYFHAEAGSGQALLSALEQFADSSGVQELKSVPIAILGHSQGGQFAFHFTCWQAQRVLAFAAIKGGYYDAVPTDAARAVPGLLIAGENDAEYRRKNLRALYDANCTGISRWAFASEANAGHEVGATLQLIIPFFEAVISENLQPYSGDLNAITVSPAESLLNPHRPWLPNRSVAELWIRLMKGTLREHERDPQIPASSPPAMAKVSPATYDYGTVESQQEASPLTLQVTPLPDGPVWTSIRAFSLQSRCEVSVSNSSGKWTISARPCLDRMPLGRISDTIHISYLDGDRTLPGGTDVDLTLNHTSADVKLSAASFFFGVHSTRTQRSITLTTGTDKALKVRSVELLTGSAAKVSVSNETDTSAEVIVDSLPLPRNDQHSGMIAVHLEKPVAKSILIPFIGYYRAPEGVSE